MLSAANKRGRAVAFVVMGHGAGAALLHRQAGLGAVECLDLRLLVDRQHHRMGRWIDIQARRYRRASRRRPWIVRELEVRRQWCGLQAVGFPDRLHASTAATPAALAIVAQASGGLPRAAFRLLRLTDASRLTRLPGAIGALPGGAGLVAAAGRPTPASCMKRVLPAPHAWSWTCSRLRRRMNRRRYP